MVFSPHIFNNGNKIQNRISIIQRNKIKKVTTNTLINLDSNNKSTKVGIRCQDSNRFYTSIDNISNGMEHIHTSKISNILPLPQL